MQWSTGLRLLLKQVVVRTKRSVVFYVRDPGAGFRLESLSHTAIGNPAGDPVPTLWNVKNKECDPGIRPSGASGTVDELIYSDIGNEALLIRLRFGRGCGAFEP